MSIRIRSCFHLPRHRSQVHFRILKFRESYDVRGDVLDGSGGISSGLHLSTHFDAAARSECGGKKAFHGDDIPSDLYVRPDARPESHVS